jgi:hypothetical protein
MIHLQSVQLRDDSSNPGELIGDPAATHLLFWRNIFLWKLRALAEKILLHLLNQELLGFRPPGLQAVFIQEHFGVLGPHTPRFSADVVINLLSEWGIKGRFIQARQFPAKLCAFHHSGHCLVSISDFTTGMSVMPPTPRWSGEIAVIARDRVIAVIGKPG